MTLWGILENIASDILFILLAIFLAWVWTQLTQRRGLQDFFSVSKAKRLVIYLSRLDVLPFGAIGASGRKFSYQGEAVAYGEMQGANQIRQLFSGKRMTTAITVLTADSCHDQDNHSWLYSPQAHSL